MSSTDRLSVAPPQLHRWRWACGLYLALIGAVVITADGGRLPVGVLPPWDVVLHFTMLGLAGWLLHRALGRRKLGRWLPLGPAIVAVLATAEEISQRAFAARTFSLADLTANLAGVAVVYGLDELWLRWRRTTSATD